MITLEHANKKHLADWDDFVEKSINGTIFHKRKFLDYHQDKFSNEEQFFVIKKGDSVIAQFCYLKKLDQDNKSIALSPYGASFGGPILKSFPTYLQSKNIVTAIIEHFNCQNIQRCQITIPLSIYSIAPLDVFTFSFLESGFKIQNMDISSIVNLSSDKIEDTISSRARNNLRKVKENQKIRIQHRASVDDFIETLDATFARHGSKPTHSHSEIYFLTKNLPNEVYVDVAFYENIPVAGICYFKINNRVLSTFYLTQTKLGIENNCLTLLIVEGIKRARSEGYMWLDFGTSSINMKARENIFKFKESFSILGVFKQTISWEK